MKARLCIALALGLAFASTVAHAGSMVYCDQYARRAAADAAIFWREGYKRCYSKNAWGLSTQWNKKKKYHYDLCRIKGVSFTRGLEKKRKDHIAHCAAKISFCNGHRQYYDMQGKQFRKYHCHEMVSSSMFPRSFNRAACYQRPNPASERDKQKRQALIDQCRSKKKRSCRPLATSLKRLSLTYKGFACHYMNAHKGKIYYTYTEYFKYCMEHPLRATKGAESSLKRLLPICKRKATGLCRQYAVWAVAYYKKVKARGCIIPPRPAEWTLTYSKHVAFCMKHRDAHVRAVMNKNVQYAKTCRGRKFQLRR